MPVGVNIAASDQNIITSIAGNETGKEVDKITVLRELGVRFYPGKKVKLLMVDGAVMNAECRVVQEIIVGDHTLFAGEVLEASVKATRGQPFEALRALRPDGSPRACETLSGRCPSPFDRLRAP